MTKGKDTGLGARLGVKGGDGPETFQRGGGGGGARAAADASPGAAAGKGEQLEAFPDAGGDRGQASTPAKRGPGRPPGKPNRRTEDVARYVLSKWGDPLNGLGQVIFGRPGGRESFDGMLERMAKALRCSRLEAYDRWLAAVRELNKFVHQEQPKAIQLGEGGFISFNLQVGEGEARKLDRMTEGGMIISGQVLNSEPEKKDEQKQ